MNEGGLASVFKFEMATMSWTEDTPTAEKAFSSVLRIKTPSAW